jgi:hypothetical protein
MVSSVAGGADPGRGAERLSERFLSKGRRPGFESVRSDPWFEGCGLWANQEQPTRALAFPGPSESQLSAFPIMKMGNTAVHAEPRSTRRESNLPPSALSAPPREKKSDWPTRDRFRVVRFPNFNFQLFFSQHPSTPVTRNPAQKNPFRRQSRHCSWGRRPRSRRRTPLRTIFEQANPR